MATAAEKPSAVAPPAATKPPTSARKTPESSSQKVKDEPQSVKSRAHKAGLVFPVGRIHRQLKEGNYAKRIGHDAPVYLAAVLEYLAAEALELSIKVSTDNKRVRVVPRYIMTALRNDEELSQVVGKSTHIASGGAMTFIHPFLVKSHHSKK